MKKIPLFCLVTLIVMIVEIPYANFFLLASSVILVYYTIIYRKRIIITLPFVLLICFISSYFILDTYLKQTFTYKFLYALSVICIYQIGYQFIDTRDSSDVIIEQIIRLISITYFFYVLVSIVNSVIKGQLAISRNPLNIWTGDLRAATHYGSMLVFPLAYGICLLFTNRDRKDKFLGILLTIGSLIQTLMIAGRSIILFTVLGIVIAYFYSIKLKGQFTSKHLKQLCLCLALIFMGYIVFEANIFNVQTIFNNSQMGKRLLNGQTSTIEEDGRMKHLRFFFENIKYSLWGGGYTRLHSGNLHNVYLNVFDLSGIVSFSFLVMFTLNVMSKFKKCLSFHFVKFETKMFLFVIFVLNFIQLFMEPVMESVPVMFWCLIMLTGMVEKVTKFDSEV